MRSHLAIWGTGIHYYKIEMKRKIIIIKQTNKQTLNKLDENKLEMAK